MSRPRYHIDQYWSAKKNAMRWFVFDGDNGINVGHPKDVSFYNAEDAMTFCDFLNSNEIKKVQEKPKDGYNGNIKGLDF